MEALPRWVYDLIIALDKYEDEHAKEAACLGDLLELVPPIELDRARVIAHYRSQPEPSEELHRVQDAHQEACETIAAMHAAAFGQTCAPVRGVIEDIADLRSRCLAAEEALDIALRRGVQTEEAGIRANPNCLECGGSGIDPYSHPTYHDGAPGVADPASFEPCMCVLAQTPPKEHP